MLPENIYVPVRITNFQSFPFMIELLIKRRLEKKIEPIYTFRYISVCLNCRLYIFEELF